MTATAPSAREIRSAVRDLSGAQIAILTEIEITGSTARRLARPTRDALIRKGIVERSVTGSLTLTALGECVAAALVPPPAPYADAGVTEDAELADVLGDDMPTEDEPEMSTAEIMARVTGSVGATVIESRVAPDGTRTELSRHSWSRPGTGKSSEPAALCDGGSRRCEGLVTDPAHVAAARAGDLSAFPYCGPCRVAAAGDAAMDEPVQGPNVAEYGPGFYRVRGLLELGATGTVPPGAMLLIVKVWNRSAVVATPYLDRTSVTFDELDRAGAGRVDNP